MGLNRPMFKDLLNKIHILQNIYFKNKYLIKKKSYAMDGEDLAIDQYIQKKNKGFYVDIGAHHPIQRNNTQLLFEINSPNIMIKTVINNEEGISQMSKCKKIERFDKES